MPEIIIEKNPSEARLQELGVAGWEIWDCPVTEFRLDFDETEKEATEQSAWREVIADIWRQLRSLVVIRQQEDAPAAVLMPEQRYFLYQNLRLQLETARFAALSGNQRMFEQSLQSASSWLEQYFVGDHRDAMLESLQAMQNQAISIETPDISGSLRWLKGFEP